MNLFYLIVSALATIAWSIELAKLDASQNKILWAAVVIISLTLSVTAMCGNLKAYLQESK